MKNILTSLALIFTSIISYSQIGVGIGYESSGNDELNSAIKLNIESLSINNISYNGFIIGLDFGINFINNDKTGESGLNINPQQETGNFVYTVLTPGFKLGYQFSNNYYLVGAAGLNMVQEYKEYNSSSNGLYVVETDYKNNSPYFRAGINYVNGFFSPGIGIGTNGFYINATFYSKSNKITNGIENRKNKIEKRRKKYQIAGNYVSDLKFKDFKGYIETFIDECIEKGINVNRDNIIVEQKNLGVNTIVKSYGKDNDGIIEVHFNKKAWKKSNIDTRLYVLFHELGRDILNFDYNQAGKMTSKLTVGDTYTWEQFSVDREVMFQVFIDNLIKEENSKTMKSRI